MPNKLRHSWNWSWPLQSFRTNVQTLFEQKKLHQTAHVKVLYLNLRVQAIKSDVNQSAGATSLAASSPVIIAPLQLLHRLMMCKQDRSSPTLSKLSKRRLFFLALTRLALPHPPLKAAGIHYSRITMYCRTVLSPIYSDKATARVKGCEGEMFPGL